ncbi:MAG: phage tail protein [Sphingomonas sp.]
MKDEQQLLELLLSATEEERRRIIRKMTLEQIARFDGLFELWAHHGQLPPLGAGWRVWLLLAGRGFGKTRAGAEWVHRVAMAKPGARIALVGASIGDARSIMIEGVSGLVKIAGLRRRRLGWEPSLGRVSWPNGSEAQLFSGDHADGLRGPEHDFAWFLTFEVIADDEPPLAGSVLADASGGVISSNADQALVGFAAYGRSIRSAVEPLVDCFDVELFDDGLALRPPSSSVAFALGANDFGNTSDGGKAPRLQREQFPVRTLPAALRLTYYDPARDFQTGEARAVAGEESGSESQQDLPVVLNAADAKSLAQEMLARSWAGKDKLTLRLPPSRLALEPGSRIQLALTPSLWRVERTTIDGFGVVSELRPSSGSIGAVPADGGRIVPNSDIVTGALSVALLDVPNVLDLPATSPAVLVASSTTIGWQRRPVEISYGGATVVTELARAKSLLGRAETILGSAAADLIDDRNSVDIALPDPDQWLTSCDDDALAAGDNLAVVGSELIQFGRATALGEGRFRLGHLLRGRGGTEWACASHAIDDLFCVIKAGTVLPVSMPSWSIGALVGARVAGVPMVSIGFLGEGARPPSPVNLAADRLGSGDLLLSWTRRSRSGFSWLDEIDAPLGEETEQYALRVTGSLSSLELFSDHPALTIPAANVAALGAGPAAVEVRQIGDLGASRPAELNFFLT